MLAAFRESKLQVATSTLLATIMQFILLIRFMHLTGQGLGQAGGVTGMVPTFALMYVPVMFMPFLANSLLIRTFIQERASGALMSILATGINPGILWAMKTTAIFICCYIISLAVLEIDVLVMIFLFKLPIVFSITNVFLITVISPLAALAIIAVVSFLYWTVRFGYMFSGLFPLIVIVVLYGFAITQPSAIELIRGAMTVTLVSGVIVFVCGYIISKTSRARLLGL